MGLRHLYFIRMVYAWKSSRKSISSTTFLAVCQRTCRHGSLDYELLLIGQVTSQDCKVVETPCCVRQKKKCLFPWLARPVSSVFTAICAVVLSHRIAAVFAQRMEDVLDFMMHGSDDCFTKWTSGCPTRQAFAKNPQTTNIIVVILGRHLVEISSVEGAARPRRARCKRAQSGKGRSRLEYRKLARAKTCSSKVAKSVRI